MAKFHCLILKWKSWLYWIFLPLADLNWASPCLSLVHCLPTISVTKGSMYIIQKLAIFWVLRCWDCVWLYCIKSNYWIMGMCTNVVWQFISRQWLELMALKKKMNQVSSRPKGPYPNSGGRPDWVRPGLARCFETTQRHRIGDVWILYTRKAMCDVCYQLLNINYFYSHQ